MTNFRLFSKEQLAALLCAHTQDFGHASTDDLKLRQLLDPVEQGVAILEADEYAAAIVRPEGWRPLAAGKNNSVLWLLLVDPAHRGQGLGEALVKRLVATYAIKQPMVLACHGEERERFFRKCGFAVTEKSKESIVMSAPPTHALEGATDPSGD